MKKAEMKLAKAYFDIDIDKMIGLAAPIADAECNKPTAQLELALMNSYASEGDRR